MPNTGSYFFSLKNKQFQTKSQRSRNKNKMLDIFNNKVV